LVAGRERRLAATALMDFSMSCHGTENEQAAAGQMTCRRAALPLSGLSLNDLHKRFVNSALPIGAAGLEMI